MRFVYSQEHITFVDQAFQENRVPEVTRLFNEKFGLNKTPSQIKAMITNKKIRCGRKPGFNAGQFRLFSQEQAEFIKRSYKKWTREVVTKALNEEFGTSFTVLQVTSFIKNHRIKSGRTGQFESGRIPHNSGTKGLMKPNKTSFQKGNVPVNHRPIGSERINVEGYVEVKVAEPNVWSLKQRLIYEKEIGPIPDNYNVRFLDGDRQKFEPSNLILVSNYENAILNRRYQLNQQPVEFRETLVIMAKIDAKENSLSRRNDERNMQPQDVEPWD